MAVTHGSLFSGIGGFDLAAEWMGWENVFHCEWNDFGQKVLKHYWPNATSYGDITKTDFSIHRGSIDIISGGFPCQPYSMAGKRKGKEDDRHLWPEMLRAIREIQPRWVVGENVLGLVNWSGGLVFHEVQTDLEAAGYEVWPYVLPACSVNAPHRRDRVWFVAHSQGIGEGWELQQRQKQREFRGLYSEGTATNTTSGSKGSSRKSGKIKSNGCHNDAKQKGGGVEAEQYNGCNSILRDAADTSNQGLQGDKINRSIKGIRTDGNKLFAGCVPSNWQDFPTQSPIRDVHDGIPCAMVRNIKQEIYATITERYTEQDLQEVWDYFQSEEIREQIGGLYKIHEPGLLLQTVQLCKTPNKYEIGVSDFSEKASEKLLRKLQNHGTFANTPRGRELEKQFREQFKDSLPFLSHEVALVTMEAERAAQSFLSWHRNESIKAAGNAIVPQVVYQIFKAIELYDKNECTY